MQRKAQIILVVLFLVLSLPVIVGFVTGTEAALPQITGFEDRIKVLETAVADLQKVNVALTTRVNTLETQVASMKSTSSGEGAAISSTPSANETLLATPVATSSVKKGTPQTPTPISTSTTSNDQKKTTATTAVKTNALNLSMVGNAVLKLPVPKDDFDVIVLKREDDLLTILVRNNTDQAVKQINVDATARSANGDLLAVTQAIGFRPAIVRPGEVTFETLYFNDAKLPEDVLFEFDVNSSNADPNEGAGDLQISENKFLENRFVGILANPGKVEVTGPIEVQVLCFDADGGFMKHYSNFTTKDKVAPGKTIPFQVDIRNSCPTYLMFATGFSF